MVGIECNDAAIASFQEGSHQYLFNFSKQGGKPDYSKYLY